MSVTKAQLVGGVGISTVGDLSVYGGVNVTGVVTASSFVGGVTGDATGLTGTPNITVGIVTASSAVISGNVSIAGTLTYEDVTNVDSIGIITARSGIDVTGGSVVVGSAVTVNSTGIDVVGVVTATSFSGDGSNLTGVGGAAAVTVLTEDTTLSSGTAYMLNTSGLVLTLPATPSTGDAVDILNNVSGIHTLARNGSTIMSLSEDMTFGEAGVKFKVWYTGSTWSLF